tara:strand:- start:34 stop:1344 length:1311 start_codon:yes stop_codon:yes gene_type:complete
MTLSLGIDVGTSGVRTAVMEGRTLLSMARANHPHQDPSRIDANGWWAAVERCLMTQISAIKDLDIDPKSIRRIAADGTSGSMVLTDLNLSPVSPALMYNSKGFDAEAAKIDALVPGEHITKGSNSALARAMRLVSHASSTPTYLLHQADFIAAKLIGQGGHSDFNNALKIGFDPEQEVWPNWIEQVVKPNILPKIHNPGTPLAQISTSMARHFGFATDVTIHAGTTDSIAAFLASAPIEEGAAVTSLGSTLAIKLLSARRIDDPSVGLYSHRLGELWLVGGASNTGGAVLKKFFSDDELTTLSKDIDPNQPLGLNYYPLIEPGERFPINNPKMMPVITPRPKSDTAFLQALFEGMAAIEASCFNEIKVRGGPAITQLFTAGGGAKNDKWTAIRARFLNQEPSIPEFCEASIGVAMLAGEEEKFCNASGGRIKRKLY